MVQVVTAPQSVLNLAEAMANMDGDAELLREIVGIFMETAPQQIRSIADAVRDGLVDKVAIEAHGMKGGASNFCAGDFVASALALERLAKGGSLAGAQSLLEKMTADLEILQEVLGLINWEEVRRQWRG